MRGLVSLGVMAVLLGGCGSEESRHAVGARWGAADLDFGRVVLGADAALPLEVENGGDEAISLALSVEGADAAAFELGGAALAVPASGQGSVDVVFRPQRRGAHAAQVRLAPCATCEAVLVDLHGEGGIVSVAVAPEALAFSPVAPGASASRSVALRNEGDFPVQIERATFAFDDDFALAATLPRLLEVDEALEVEVTFSPAADAALGSRENELQVVTDQIAPLVVPISAHVGHFDLVPEPAELRLGICSIGEYVVEAVELTNRGDAPLRIVGASLAPDTSPCLTLRPFVGSRLEPGEATSVRVELLPRRECFGVARGTLEIELEGVEGRLSIPVTGNVSELGVDRTEVTCPPHSTAVAGEPVRLEGEVVWAGDRPGSCSWQILEAPPGAEVVLDGTACSTEFVPDRPGAYVLEFAGVPEWEPQLGAACTTTIHVAAAP